MGLLVCMVVMLLLMESGSIKVFAAGALLGLWLGCMRMVESESVKERKAGARVRLWVKEGMIGSGLGIRMCMSSKVVGVEKGRCVSIMLWK